MLSTKGNEVLKVIYDSYRTKFIAENPGCNENDVERAFLFRVYISFPSEHTNKNVWPMIDGIR